jgi:CubicO group peptidase (beta-lactamase class C family)
MHLGRLRPRLASSAGAVVVSLLLVVAPYQVPSASPATLSQPKTAVSATATPVSETVPDLRGVAPLPLEGERRAAFDSFIVDALAKCQVPGAAVAVVQNGAVDYLQGFGVRQLGRPDPVTPDTVMGIGSVTKSVTATMAATLVDAGLVKWSTPVSNLLPDFALSDATVTPRVTLADLFSASTGLPRRDAELSFEADVYTPQRLIAAVKALPLTAPLGTTYHYSNQAFALGGYAAAAADGASSDDLLSGYFLSVQHWVLNPLGMTRSAFRLEDVLHSGNYAVPHATERSGKPVPIPQQTDERFTTAVAPAGAMWSSARDMARYLQMQLSHGVAPDGRRLVSSENLERTWRPGVAVPPDPNIPPAVAAGLAHYGLGWFIGAYGGLKLVSHSGGTYGFSSEVAFLPEAGLGIAVLTNEAPCGALVAFAAQYRLFELVFNQAPAAADEFDAYLGAVKAQRLAAAVALGPLDPNAVKPILGRFVHPALGEITLRLENDELVIDAGEVRSRLQPLRIGSGGATQYVMIDPPMAGAPANFTFERDAGGRWRPVLTVQGEPGEAPIVYSFTSLVPQETPIATPAA